MDSTCKFKPGDIVRKKNGGLFSNKQPTATVAEVLFYPYTCEWLITLLETGGTTIVADELELVDSTSKDALSSQVGGDHYKKMGIQPVEYIRSNELDYFEGNVIKYVTRHRSKGGRKDIEKAIHYLQMILENDYAEDAKENAASGY